jgi:phage terminase large subunit-like protein
VALKFDYVTGETMTKKRKKYALEKYLRARGNREELVKLCEQNDVSHEISSDKIREGWAEKPKGTLTLIIMGVK